MASQSIILYPGDELVIVVSAGQAPETEVPAEGPADAVPAAPSGPGSATAPAAEVPAAAVVGASDTASVGGDVPPAGGPAPQS